LLFFVINYSILLIIDDLAAKLKA